MPESKSPSPKLVLTPRRHVLNNGVKGARIAADGRGNERAIAAAAAQLFALTPPNDPGPRVITSIADVTSGMGLDASMEARVQGAVSQSSVALDKRGGESRTPIARGALMQILRSTDISPGARTEILTRANAWWKNNARTDYGKPTGASAYAKSLTMTVPVLVLGVKP